MLFKKQFMERNEILKYLELDAAASVADMRASIEEKLKSFDAIAESINSDFLKKMHKKNIDKALMVRDEIMQLKDLPEMPVAALPAMDDILVNDRLEDDMLIQPAARGNELNFSNTTPVIIGSKSKHNLNKANEPAGWLVRHTENQTAITFTIFPGKNYLGRKQQPGLTHFIVIDDVYVSRVHAVIEVEEAAEYEFYINDNETANLGKPSKNGTYLNADDKRVNQKTRLLENDTIQIGLTKMILKINRDNNLKRIIKEVQSSKFMDTVIIKSE